MNRRKTLSDNGVAALKAKPARYTFPDPELRGHYVRVMPSGAKTFVAVSRNPAGKQVWATVGATDMLGIEAARDAARAIIGRIKQGLPAIEEKPPAESFGQVAENYLKRHVDAKGLLSAKEIRRCLHVYVLPHWRDREFGTIRRGDVATLLDRIEDDNGGRQADYVLAIVRGICNWYATRHDDYVSPIVRGMRRTQPNSRKRERILTDDEIRTLWATAQTAGTFGAIVRFALATAQRRDKILAMRWSELSADGVWTVPSEDRQKGTGGDLRLPAFALAIIEGLPRIGDNPFVFAGRGEGHFNGMSKAKIAFDIEQLKRHQSEGETGGAKPSSIDPWVIHDLRRTARSLMSRAGVRPEVAERVLGHVIKGVEGIYDRHHYRDEKADALARLAELLSQILNPTDNVVMLVRAGE